MKTIQEEEQGNPKRGLSKTPYTVEEYEAMLDAGTWTGGFVLELGYCGIETIIEGSSESNSSEDSSSEYNPDDDKPLIDPDDNDDSTIIDGGNGGNGNTCGDAGGGTGGTTTGGGGNSVIVENAGEAENTSVHTYTESEANDLIDRGLWKGGYVQGLGYVGPNVEILPSTTVLPSNGDEVLERALEFINVPYLMGGCDKNGIDCSGLVSVALNIPRWTTKSGDIPSTTKVELSNKNSNFVAELQKGDILVWRGSGGKSGHAVIYVEGTKIFHAHGNAGAPTGYTYDLLTYWYNTKGIPEVYRK